LVKPIDLFLKFISMVKSSLENSIFFKLYMPYFKKKMLFKNGNDTIFETGAP
jgi:hypothetical protein